MSPVQLATAEADRHRNNRPFSDTFERLLSASSGTVIDVSFRELVGKLPARELSHGMYPYPARLVRQIPRLLLGAEGFMDGVQRVLDPFCGSGTVLVESGRSGVGSIGLDVNPIAVLASRVKTQPISSAIAMGVLEEVEGRARSYRRPSWEPPPYLHKWYRPSAWNVLRRLAEAVEDAGHSGEVDAARVALALTARRASFRDPRIPVPVRSASRPTAGLGGEAVWASFRESMFGVVAAAPKGEWSSLHPRVLRGDARDPEAYGRTAKGVDVIITSPPYGTAQKYPRAVSLEAGWLGYASPTGTSHLERSTVGRERLTRSDADAAATRFNDIAGLEDALSRVGASSVYRESVYRAYFADMRSAIKASLIASPKVRRIGLIAGTNVVAGQPLATHHYLRLMYEACGFKVVLAARDAIRGRALLTTRNHGAAPAASEYVYVLERA